MDSLPLNFGDSKEDKTDFPRWPLDSLVCLQGELGILLLEEASYPSYSPLILLSDPTALHTTLTTLPPGSSIAAPLTHFCVPGCYFLEEGPVSVLRQL